MAGLQTQLAEFDLGLAGVAKDKYAEEKTTFLGGGGCRCPLECIVFTLYTKLTHSSNYQLPS